MRLLRWIVILSSIAYWYSIFSMQPLGKRPLEPQGTFWEQLEELDKLPTPETEFGELSQSTQSTKRSKQKEEEKTDETIIIFQATREPTISNAIKAMDKLIAEYSFQDYGAIQSIAQRIASKFSTNYLYVLSKTTNPKLNKLFNDFLSTMPLTKDVIEKALRAAIAYNDYDAVSKMLSNKFFVSELQKDKTILDQLSKFAFEHKKEQALKAIRDMHNDQKFPVVPLPSLTTKPVPGKNKTDIFVNLLKSDYKITESYYARLQELLKEGVLLNPERAEINPLLISASLGKVDVTKWLLSKGANPDSRITKDATWTTPRAVLETRNYPHKKEILELLHSQASK